MTIMREIRFFIGMAMSYCMALTVMARLGRS